MTPIGFQITINLGADEKIVVDSGPLPPNEPGKLSMPNEKFSFADEPAPEIKQPHKSSPQLLLDWLLQHWNKSTISVRAIGVYAPRAIRDREIMINSAEALARHGWLSELKAHRHDRRVWRIDRKPIIHPTVPTK